MILSKFSTRFHSLVVASKHLDAHPRWTGEQNSTATLENGLAAPTKLAVHFPDGPATSFVGIYPREIKTHIHTETKISMTALIYQGRKHWKQPQCPPTEKRVNRLVPRCRRALLSSERKRPGAYGVDKSHQHAQRKNWARENTQWVMPFTRSSRTNAKLSYGNRSQRSSYLGGGWWWCWPERDTKEPSRAGSVCYLDLGGGYTGACVGRNQHAPLRFVCFT